MICCPHDEFTGTLLPARIPSEAGTTTALLLHFIRISPAKDAFVEFLCLRLSVFF
jgi:hypothetical protein